MTRAHLRAESPSLSVSCYAHGMETHLTVTEAARELGLSASALRARLQRGDMQAERAGIRLWLIPRVEVERWRARGRLRPGPKPGTGTRGRGGRRQSASRQSLPAGGRLPSLSPPRDDQRPAH
jgi:excisionase family DNA binding protein